MTASFWNRKATQLMRLTHDTYFPQTRHWNNRSYLCPTWTKFVFVQALLISNKCAFCISKTYFFNYCLCIHIYHGAEKFVKSPRHFQLIISIFIIKKKRKIRCKSIRLFLILLCIIYQWKIDKLCFIIWKWVSIILGNNLLLNYPRQFIWAIAQNLTEMTICGHRHRIICKEVKYCLCKWAVCCCMLRTNVLGIQLSFYLYTFKTKCFVCITATYITSCKLIPIAPRLRQHMRCISQVYDPPLLVKSTFLPK